MDLFQVLPFKFSPSLLVVLFGPANKELITLDYEKGSFSLYTALATTDGVLFQYWVYTATERSDKSQVQSKSPQNQHLCPNIYCCYKFDLSGQLVDTGIAEAVALNAFVIEAPIIPYQCTGSTVCISQLFPYSRSASRSPN